MAELTAILKYMNCCWQWKWQTVVWS